MLFSVMSDNSIVMESVTKIEYPKFTVIHDFQYSVAPTFIQFMVTYEATNVFDAGVGRRGKINTKKPYNRDAYYAMLDRVKQWPLMQYDVDYIMVDVHDEHVIVEIDTPYVGVTDAFNRYGVVCNDNTIESKKRWRTRRKLECALSIRKIFDVRDAKGAYTGIIMTDAGPILNMADSIAISYF